PWSGWSGSSTEPRRAAGLQPHFLRVALELDLDVRGRPTPCPDQSLGDAPGDRSTEIGIGERQRKAAAQDVAEMRDAFGRDGLVDLAPAIGKIVHQALARGGIATDRRHQVARAR